MLAQVLDKTTNHHPLWSMSQTEVLSCLQTGCFFQDFACHNRSCSRRNRGFQDNQHSWFQMFSDTADGTFQRTEIRNQILWVFEGSLYSNTYRIHLRDNIILAAALELSLCYHFSDEVIQSRLFTFQRIFSSVQCVYFVWGDVKSVNLLSLWSVSLKHGCRDSDISHTNKTDLSDRSVGLE